MKFSRSIVLGLATVGAASAAFAPSTFSAAHTIRSGNAPFPLAAVAVEEDVLSKPSQAVVAEAMLSIPKEAREEEVIEIVKTSTPKADAVSSSTASEIYQIKPGRYDATENSIAIPFLKRPSKLDGSHAGDHGFDPLGLSESLDLYTMQEAELRHARLAMLAVVGWPISELLAPDWMLQQNGCAPSVLNGFNPITFVATLLAFAGFSLFEYATAFRASASTEMGKLHHKDMADVWKYGVAGDYNWDPLNWYSNLLGDSPVARKGLREVEIAHGRSAMLGITAFATWEALTGHPIVENSMFFHPNLLLPALVTSYFVFNQFYEVTNTDQYVLQIQMTEEGKAKSEAMQMKMGKFAQDNEGTFEVIGEYGEKAFEAVKNAAKEAKKQYDEQYL